MTLDGSRMVALTTFDHDIQLRLAAFARLDEVRRRRGGVVTAADLEEGVEFAGERVALWNRAMGIWKPAQLDAALSVRTTPPRPDRPAPYDDEIAHDAGWIGYKYQGTDPRFWTNVAVRRAMEEGRPLVYLYGLVPGVYEAIWPVFVVHDDPDNLTFHLAAEAAGARIVESDRSAEELAAQRAYATNTVKVRLHQARFRQLVLRAYRTTCTVCRLRRGELLDAAHIIPDRDERGRPEVPNGLCMCKIHHAAFDAGIMGIAPDHVVHVRRDVLEEIDGPMLTHGLQEVHGQAIRAPSREVWRPSADFLAERFERFVAN